MKLTLDDLRGKVAEFRDERNWKRFHNPKDLAISISIEASELLELFQWKRNREISRKLGDSKFLEKVKSELADVLIYCLSLSDVLKIDLEEAVISKLEENKKRYPPRKP
ncbi:MAG: nucleotide pyrophosphohydrolase [Candidatus Methanofastidiosia archaeon]